MKADPKQLFVHEPDCQLRCARFSLDGRVLFAGGLDASVRRWLVKKDKLEELPALKGHNGWISRIVVHPTHALISADTWGQLRFTDFEDDKPKVLWKHDEAHDGWIRDVAVSVDGKRIATCGRDRALRVWSREGELLHEHNESEDLLAVTFAPDGHSVWFGNEKGSIQCLGLIEGELVAQVDGSAFYKYDRIQDIGGLQGLVWYGESLVAYGTKPQNGATVRGVPSIQLYDVKSGEMTKSIEVDTNRFGFIHDLEMHPEGFLMGAASGTPGSGLLFFLRPEEDKPFYKHTKVSNLHSVTMHPDGRRLAFTATNRRSNGNGRRLDENGKYPANNSPIHVFEIPGVPIKWDV